MIMVKSFQILICCLLLGSMPASRHTSSKLLVAGSANACILVIDKQSGQVEWKYPLEEGWECNSVARTDDGAILFSYGRGARLIHEDGTIIWDQKVSDQEDLQTAAILPDGGFLLAVSGHPSYIREVDMQGNTVKEISFETGVDDPHFQFRRVIKTSNGNYMVPLFMGGKVLEVSSVGKVIREFPVEGYPFAIRELPGNKYLVSGGDAHSFAEIDCRGKVIRRTGSEDIKNVSLQFVAEVVPVQDHFYICNWQGHEKENPDVFKNPQLLEIDAAGNVVWALPIGNTLGFISTVYPFEK